MNAAKAGRDTRLHDFEIFKSALANVAEGRSHILTRAPADPVPAAVIQMWIDRACEIRRFAEMIETGYGKYLLLCLANDYERLAKNAL